MLLKLLIILVLLIILYTLGSAFFLMLKDKGEGTRTVRRLSWRIGLSVLLLLLIMLAMRAGWLQPGSAGPVRYPQPAESASGGP